MPKSSTTGGAIGGPFDTTGTTNSWLNTTGAVGATYQTGTASYTLTNNATYTVGYHTPNEFESDVYINRNGKQIPVAKTLEYLMERLCIIEPSFEQMEKYPALKAAYDNYKLIEALIKNDNGDNNE